LLARDHAVGLDFKVMRGKRGVLVKQPAQRQFASAPDAESDDASEHEAGNRNGKPAKTALPPLARTQFYVEDVFACEAAV
jgi:hypothetical protein